MNDTIQDIFSSLDDYENNIHQKRPLGVSQEYHRENYEDLRKLTAYKESTYGGKKTIIDPYSKNVLHRNIKAAKAKYGKGHVTSHISQTDHIMPLKAIHRITKYNPLLRDDDIKAAGNRWYNYTEVSAHDNMSKQDNTNFTESAKALASGNIQKAVVQAGQGILATTAITAELTARSVYNASTVIPTSSLKAISDASMYLSISAVKDLYLAADGKISSRDAAEHLTKTTLQIVKQDAIRNISKSALLSVASSIKNKQAKRLLHTSAALTLAEITMSAVIDCLCSDEKLSVETICNKFVDNTVGTVSGFLQTTAMLLPVPGLGITVGLSMLITSVCTSIYNLARISENSMQQKNRMLSAVSSDALAEINRQHDILKHMIDNTYTAWDDIIEKSFNSILTGAMNNDVDEIASGLDNTLNLIGKGVRFKDNSSFDDFFMNKDSVFVF